MHTKLSMISDTYHPCVQLMLGECSEQKETGTSFLLIKGDWPVLAAIVLILLSPYFC
jgi:hypothetical protein